MMLSRLRRRGSYFAVTVAITGLMSSGPVQADELAAGDRVESLTAVVATLDETIVRTVDPIEAEEKVYKAAGQGTASYYGSELAGNRTASGERFNPAGLTAAHRSLPLGTKLRVTNKANGEAVIVRVNDRGPFVKHRLLDVSLGAAKQIGMVRTGTARVTIEILRTA